MSLPTTDLIFRDADGRAYTLASVLESADFGLVTPFEVTEADLGAAYTLDFESHSNVYLDGTLSGACTLSFSNLPVGASEWTLALTADGSARVVTLPGGSTVSVPASSTVTVTGYSPDGLTLRFFDTRGLIVQDEGTPLAIEGTLDFAGAGVSVANSAGKNTVTIPGAAGATPLYCRLTHSASQTPGADAAVTFDTESTDQGGLHAGGNPTRITIPADGDGFYVLTACIDDAGTSGTRGIYFKKNGTTELARSDVNSTNGRGALSTAAHLVATDYVELFYGGTFAIDATAERSPIFAAARVG